MRSKNLKELEGWTLPELVEYLTMIRPNVRKAGFELGVTGSVLFDGKSTNDGDVWIHPEIAGCLLHCEDCQFKELPCETCGKEDFKSFGHHSIHYSLKVLQL